MERSSECDLNQGQDISNPTSPRAHRGSPLSTEVLIASYTLGENVDFWVPEYLLFAD